MAEAEHYTRKRPRLVTWLALLVLLLGVANLIGAYGLLLRWQALTLVELSLPLWALLAPAAVWGVIWPVLALGLWGLRPWARLGVMFGFPLYELILVGRQVVFAQGAYSRGALPLKAALALALTAIIIVVLTRPRIRRAFDWRGTKGHRITQETETL